MRSPMNIMTATIMTAAFLLCAAAALHVTTATATPLFSPVSTTPQEAQTLSAKDAGARYGEAAGAALVCASLRITPRVTELRARYQGDALDEFDAQAGKVLQAWREALNCEHADGPADCRLSQQLSCRQALKEIGPGGSVLQGLVEQKE